jgi:predicted nucleic acid-binding protein
MSAKVFLDTNLLIYYTADNLEKKKRVRELLLASTTILISTQVVNEFVAVTVRKGIHPRDEAIRYALEFMDLFTVIPVDVPVVRRSFDLMGKHGFSNWDSLILAAALEHSCALLYSEDLQHGQIIDRRLTIINPFIEA